MRFMKRRTSIILSMLILAGGQVLAQTTGELLQQGLYAEEIEGNLPEAIVHYEQIVNDASASPNHIAQALYHQGVCYIRLSDEARAQAALTRLINDYADQTAIVEKAKPLLAQIRSFDPATLMPPDTLVYLELGSPGEQIETILQMLKGTPLENPLEALMEKASKDSPTVNLNGVAVSVLNPVMLEEFKKIESFSMGIQGIQQPNPDFVGVINLGKNNMLRGLLLTTISMATQPGPVIGGVQTFVIPDNKGMIACDEQTYFIASSSEQLMWSIKQYAHLSNEASLATSNPTFMSMDKRIRQKNLATLWVDADTLLSQVLPSDPSAGNTFMPSPFIVMTAEGTDDLMLTASLTTNAVTLDAQINFKDGMPNPLYEMVRTPALSESGWSAIPSEAFALATLAPPRADTVLIQQLLLSLQDAGLDEPLNQLLENVQQVSLFALPGRTEMGDIPFRPGLAIACSDTAPVAAALQSLLMLLPDAPPLQVEEASGFVFVALEKDVIEAARLALATHTSVNEKGALTSAVEKHAGQVQKLISVNGNGIFEAFVVMMALESNLSPEEGSAFYSTDYTQLMKEISELLQSTTLTIYTDEKPQTLSLHAELTNIPPLKDLLESVQKTQAVVREIEQKVWDAEIQKLEVEIGQTFSFPSEEMNILSILKEMSNECVSIRTYLSEVEAVSVGVESTESDSLSNSFQRRTLEVVGGCSPDIQYQLLQRAYLGGLFDMVSKSKEIASDDRRRPYDDVRCALIRARASAAKYDQLALTIKGRWPTSEEADQLLNLALMTTADYEQAYLKSETKFSRARISYEWLNLLAYRYYDADSELLRKGTLLNPQISETGPEVADQVKLFEKVLRKSLVDASANSLPINKIDIIVEQLTVLYEKMAAIEIPQNVFDDILINLPRFCQNARPLYSNSSESLVLSFQWYLWSAILTPTPDEFEREAIDNQIDQLSRLIEHEFDNIIKQHPRLKPAGTEYSQRFRVLYENNKENSFIPYYQKAMLPYQFENAIKEIGTDWGQTRETLHGAASFYDRENDTSSEEAYLARRRSRATSLLLTLFDQICHQASPAYNHLPKGYVTGYGSTVTDNLLFLHSIRGPKDFPEYPWKKQMTAPN